MPKKKKPKYIGKSTRPATNIIDLDVDMINSAMSLGRKMLPPVGTKLKYRPPRAPDADWDFLVLEWIRGNVYVHGFDKPRSFIVGLHVREKLDDEHYGEHFFSLEGLEHCEIVELSNEAPHFTKWLSLFVLEQAMLAAMVSKKKYYPMMVAVEI